METALAFFLFYEGSNLFFAYTRHPVTVVFWPHKRQKTAPQRGFSGVASFLYAIHGANVLTAFFEEIQSYQRFAGRHAAIFTPKN